MRPRRYCRGKQSIVVAQLFEHYHHTCSDLTPALRSFSVGGAVRLNKTFRFFHIFLTICYLLLTTCFLYADTGLVGYWKFDEGSGTTATDSSGNGNTGTIYGATWVDGKSGKALSFDGNDDYVVSTTVNFSTGSADRTISFWVKSSNMAVGNKVELC